MVDALAISKHRLPRDRTCPSAFKSMGWLLLARVGELLTVEAETFESVFVFAIPALSFKIDNADLSSLVIDNLHLSHVFDVHCAEDQVFDLSHGPVDGEVLARALQEDVLQADRHCFHVADRETHLGMRLHREIVVL